MLTRHSVTLLEGEVKMLRATHARPIGSYYGCSRIGSQSRPQEMLPHTRSVNLVCSVVQVARGDGGDDGGGERDETPREKLLLGGGPVA